MKPVTFTTSILTATVLGAALLTFGAIGFSATPGEMSKIAYTGNLWCVSNLVDKTDASGKVIINPATGQGQNDPLIEQNIQLLRRDQVSAESKEEAEKKATQAGLFEPSDKTQLIAALSKSPIDSAFFTSHFNTGATHPGPCLGSGTSTIEGMWIGDEINKDCFGAPDQTGQYAVIKTLQATLTWYSPNMPGNTCDSSTGGGANTAGGGMFKMVNGRIRYVQGGSIEDYVFAEPTTDDIIPRNLWDTQAIVISGFNNNQPIHIRDHYKEGNHANQNYLDLFAPCNDRSGLPTGSQTIQVVDLNKPVQTASSSTSKAKTIAIDPGVAQTNGPTQSGAPAKSTGASPKCPPTPLKAGPSEGEDYQLAITHQINLENQRRFEAQQAASGQCKFDTNAEQAIVNEAMKYAPGADGKTKVKYVSGGRSPSSGFDCSGFVKYVLQQAKAAGTNIDVPITALSTAEASVGKVINKIDINAFTLPSGGAKLRTQADMPKLSDLRPGDILFFGTSTQYSDKKKSPNVIGHVGIYLGDGKYIQSTSSDQDLSKDSASSANPTSQPPFTAHPQGSQYSDYNGVKVSNLYDSYFTPGLYIQVNRVTHSTDCTGNPGSYGKAVDLGTTANPGGASAHPSYSSCHGRSLCNPNYNDTHNTINGYSSGNGDAVDVSTDGNVYAAFDGTAVAHKGGGAADLAGIRLTSNSGKVVADYYHVNITKSGAVKAGDKIGSLYPLGKPHVHFELSINGQIVHGNPGSSSNPQAYQQSLWQNMEKVLGLTT